MIYDLDIKNNYILYIDRKDLYIFMYKITIII